MTIQKFIEKAISGGWECTCAGPFIKNPATQEVKNGWLIQKAHPTADGWEAQSKTRLSDVMIEIVVLDPLAWQAVGKVEGWKLHDSRWEDGLCTDCYEEESHSADWLVNMHRMVDALAEGKTIEEFLETI